VQGVELMKRIEVWGMIFAGVAAIAAIANLAAYLHIEWDRFRVRGIQAPVGVSYSTTFCTGCERVAYDLLCVRNLSTTPMEDVHCRIFNPESGQELVLNIGRIEAKNLAWICNFEGNPRLPPAPYEINPRDTIEITAKGYISMHFTMKALGKEMTLATLPKPPQAVQKIIEKN
jgi:hypothetical protein